MAIVFSDMLMSSKFAIETGLLSKQLNEKKTGSMSSKSVQLAKRRWQRKMRKGLVKKSLKRRMAMSRKNINKRKITMFKANRKRRRTVKVFRRRRK